MGTQEKAVADVLQEQPTDRELIEVLQSKVLGMEGDISILQGDVVMLNSKVDQLQQYLREMGDMIQNNAWKLQQ